MLGPDRWSGGREVEPKIIARWAESGVILSLKATKIGLKMEINRTAKTER